MIPDTIRELAEKVFSDSGLGKWFNKESAGGGPGWDRYNSKGERIGKCGDAKEGESYSACLSKQKAQKLGKEGVGKFVRRKRRAQNKAGRGKKGDVKGKGKKPVFVKTGVTDMKESFDTFIVEGASNIFKMQFMPIEAKDILPYDIIISENGELFEVQGVLINENVYEVYLTDSYENEYVEQFSPDTVMGFVDNLEDVSEDLVKEEQYLFEDENKKVKLNKIMKGDVKKYKVYVKNDKGNVVKVNFGDPNMEIKRDDPDRRRNFRARHNCDTPGPRWKARYWACKTWSTQSVTSMLKEDVTAINEENKPKDSKKWSNCIAQAKKKFDVYPSAYANAWASKCYKGKGGKWKKVAEDFTNASLSQLNEKSYDSDLYGLLDYHNQKNKYIKEQNEI